jgi:hypothetical protein
VSVQELVAAEPDAEQALGLLDHIHIVAIADEI